MTKFSQISVNSSPALSDTLIGVGTPLTTPTDQMTTIQDILNLIGSLQAWSPTLTGFSGTPTTQFQNLHIGNVVWINFAIQGTFDGNTVQFTLPTAIDNAGFYENSLGLTFINGANQPAGRIYSSQSNSIILQQIGGTTWSNGNSASLRGQLMYKT